METKQKKKRRLGIIIFGSVSTVVLVLLLVIVISYKPDPVPVAKTFLSALWIQDFRDAEALVTKHGLIELENREGLLYGLKKRFTLKASPPVPQFLISESQSNDQALVTFRYREDPTKSKIEVHLKWENGAWKIDSF